MSRGLTDVPMIVVGNKTDLLRRDLASDKFRHDVINKVRGGKHGENMEKIFGSRILSILF